MEIILKCYLFYDLLFVSAFCLDGLVRYSSNPFVVTFVAITLLTYHPIYLYFKETSSFEVIKDKSWHFKHLNTCLFYCFLRGVTIIVYITAVIIDISHIDIPHSVLHFPLFSYVVVFGLFAFLIILCWLTYKIRLFHYDAVDNVLKTIQVTQHVYYTDHEPITIQSASNFDDLQLGSAYNVYLAPNPLAMDITSVVTFNSAKEMKPL